MKLKKKCTNCNNSYKKGVRTIETEGQEPVFFKGKMIYHNPNDPTHKEGGVPAIVVDKNAYTPEQLMALNKTSSTKIFPEGSSIITAEKGKATQAINAYKAGRKTELNTIIKSMPEDQAKKGKKSLKYIDGTEDLKGGKGGGLGYYQYNPSQTYLDLLNKPSLIDTFRQNAEQLTSGLPDNNQQAAWEAQNKYSTQALEDRYKSYLADKGARRQQTLNNLGNTVNTIGTALAPLATTPAIMRNLQLGGQMPVLQERNYLNKQTLSDSYNIQPQLNNINSTFANQAGVINNTAGTIQYRNALMQSAYNNKRQANSELLANKANYLTNLRNQQVQMNQQVDATNLNLKNQYNYMDEAARAKKADATTKAYEQLGDFGGDMINYLTKLKQNKYNQNSVKELYDMLESRNDLSRFKTSTNTKKMGAKSLKKKNC